MAGGFCYKIARNGMDHTLECIVCGNMVADIIGRPIDGFASSHGAGHNKVRDVRLFTGGFACNVAIDLARLGVRTGIISRVGNDEWKDMMISRLEEHGVNLSGLTVDAKEQTSATIVCVDSSGERTFYHTLGAQRNFTADDILRRGKHIAQAKVFAFGYYGLLPSFDKEMPGVFKKLKSRCNTKILLDTCGSVGPTLPLLARSLPYVDFFIPSYHEARKLTNVTDPSDMVKVFRDHGAASLVGIKLGADGCLLDDGQRSVRVPAFPVRRVVDTTGAGDSFLAGVITAYLRGMDLGSMARFANAVGSCCVQKLGASTGILSFEATKRILRRERNPL